MYPEARYELKRDDNIFLQAPGSNLVKSDTIQVLSAKVRAEAKQGANVYGGTVGAASGWALWLAISA